jgi:hypothetical protein
MIRDILIIGIYFFYYCYYHTMSDTESETEMPTIEMPAKAKKPISEAARTARTANMAKARTARNTKSVEKKQAEKEQKEILRQIVEREKLARKAVSDTESEDDSDSEVEFVLSRKDKADHSDELAALRAELTLLKLGQQKPLEAPTQKPLESSTQRPKFLDL